MSRQNGVTLIEMMFVIALASVLTLLSFYEKQSDLEQSRARQVGGLIYQYNNAVRSALAQGMVTASTIKTGTSWLKNSTCGGTQVVDSEYLPCDFPSATISDPILFGRLDFSTAIVVTGTPPNSKYTATTITSPFTLTSNLGVPKVRADLAGVASLSAAAALTTGFRAGANGLTPYTATTDSSYKSDALTAKITFVASNTANNDVWLRTDGGNKMHASLGFDGANSADRTIVGASSIENFAGQVLKIGSGSGLAPATGAGVVIDSTAEILGDFRVRRTLTVDNSVSVTGDVTATRNVTAGGAVVGQVFYDANNMGYSLDPDSTSNLNALVANSISSNGRVRAAEYVEVGGVASIGAGCSPNGLIGRTAAGSLLSCQSGVWRSTTSNMKGTFITGTFDGGCRQGNPFTGSCSCPPGAGGYLSGQAFQYTQWDATIITCYEVN